MFPCADFEMKLPGVRATNISDVPLTAPSRIERVIQRDDTRDLFGGRHCAGTRR
jgi:hypothetical protein